MNTLRHFSSAGVREYALTGQALMIGSAADCDVVLPSPGIAPIAMELVRRGSSWEARTTGECLCNGDTVAGKRILKPGDRLTVGDEVFIFDEKEDTGIASSVASMESLSPAASQQFSLAEAIRDFARQASEDADIQRLLENSLASAKKALHATDAFILTWDAQGELKSLAGLKTEEGRHRFSDSIVQTVLRDGQGLVLTDALKDGKFGSARSISEMKLLSVICAPILLGGKITGCVYLGSRQMHVAYGEKDLKALQAYAQLLGLLVHNVEFMEKQAADLRRLSNGPGENGLIAQSAAMEKVLRQADAVAASDIAVLIQGDTGTGKELLAERLHRRSPRHKGPLVAVNCSSLRGELLESEMFGYKRGAFTGAQQDRQGLFAAARGGTLFLDEIGEMDVSLQAKLLRALETGKIRPVGATQEEDIDVRVVCATHRQLKDMMAAKEFREDLYYRLAPVTLSLPPLKERGDDALLLAHAFLEKFKARYPGKDIRGFHPQSLKIMKAYAWPGNVRELLNSVHKSVLLSSGPLLEMDLGTGTDVEGNPEFLGWDEATREFQRGYLNEALSLAGGNREQAAKILKMSRSTFFRYLSQLEAE